VLDYTNPADPIILADYRSGSNTCYNIFVWGNYIFMTGYETGLSIFEYLP
jgi:hypothetical protein